MRAPLFTLVSLIALVAAFLSSSIGAPEPDPTPAPLVRADAAAEVAAADSTSDPALLLAPLAPARSGSAAASDGLPGGSATAAEVGSAAEGARPAAPTAWAAYDPRAERNARYRAESLPRALAGLTAEDISASLRVAYAISIETAAIFTELDERRESFYVPDDGHRHPLTFAAGHHSVACGGANYVFAEGRFPLYDALVRLEDSSASSPELQAWTHACPLEAELRARSDGALLQLGAYR